jgi:tripartite-type tricarboxylate transporter receptor subunit TctC
LGGQVQYSFQNVNAVLSYIQAGTLKAIAVTGDKRSSVLPNVPTMAEAGVNNVVVYSWQAVAAPKGLPADLKTRLNQAIVASLNEPETKRRLMALGFEVVANTPEAFERFQHAELARWKKVIETGHISIN